MPTSALKAGLRMMAARKESLAFLLLLLSTWSTPSDCQNCVSQITCGDCINQGGCAWCSQENFNGIRCQQLVNLTNSNCEFVENPASTPGATEAGTGNLRTINFQKVGMNLRVGDPHTFSVTVTPQRNLPLDLYILIDVSGSMGTELETVRNISSQIANRVMNVTTNVRIGFGTFIDKPIKPFAQEFINGTVSGDVHAFRHIVSLTNDSASFARQVANIRVSFNIDIPENGLEGLAQVITCQEIIGWRQSGIGTRLVLFMTDEEFHYAGEGRLAGIVKPYDGTCLLEPNPNGGQVEYTRATEFDYPSVGQILDLLQTYSVFTIFAVLESRTASYQALTNTILNVNGMHAVVQGFNVDSQDSIVAQNAILDIIGNQYVTLLQGVSLDISELTADPSLLNVSVSVRATCDNSVTVQDGSGCEGVPIETPINFDVTVTLNSCEGLNDGQVLRRTISTSAFGSFEVEITVICNCGCARDADPSPSDDCMGNGVERCGVCECDPGRCGVSCNQIIGDRSASECPLGGVNNLTCSGGDRGSCECVCICGDDIYGDACQCDNFRCLPLTEEGDVCSGRGQCCEGVCMCDPAPSGNLYRGQGARNNCQCEPEDDVCKDPNTDLICNGIGSCGCNGCDCANRDFTGMFCDVTNGRCDVGEDLDCIGKCRDAYNDDQLPDNCTCSANRPLLFVFMEAIVTASSLATYVEGIANARLEGDGYVLFEGPCQYLEGSCQTEYYILRNSFNFAVVAVREPECSNALNLIIPVWALAPIILGCLIILGILLVILIKIIFTILDYIEVKKWQKDAQGADFSKNTNPLYQSPEMKYENVAYGKE